MTNIRNLVLAFLITIIAGIAIFYIFKALFNVDDKVAQGAAAIPLTALPKIYEELEKTSARNSSTSSGKLIESLAESGVRWQIMVLYGTLIFVGIQNGLSIYSGAVYGFIEQATGGQLFITHPPPAVFMVPISFPILIVSLYLTGRWVGSRCSKYGVAVVLMSYVLGFVLTRTLDYFMISDEDYLRVFGAQGDWSGLHPAS